ncbi:MAG: FtsX-like permease family protein [Bacteroidetes bacterium]|jgi:putative ABC transport system permease protein|nr:FtsX-like permease family protein [Bacteroidota bacterium]
MALFIATLGLVNTMVMSIYERTQEIGIMKSIGAKESEIKAIFILESGVVGIIGGVFGIPLGWGITQIAELVLKSGRFGEIPDDISFFSFPLYLVLAALLFSLLVSMIAGFYPAQRAARIDPVEALRHD